MLEISVNNKIRINTLQYVLSLANIFVMCSQIENHLDVDSS